MRKTMDFTDESVREMVLGAADAEKQISDIAELTGLTEDQIKEIAYSSPAPEPKPHRHRTYDWEKLDPRIVAMIRAGSTVEEIAGKLGIGFKSAARRCTALRKEIRSGEADAAPDPDPEPRPAQPDPTPEPEEELQALIKDSGNRREFETGAVRDMPDGKVRIDLQAEDTKTKDNNITAADEVNRIDQDPQCKNEPVIEPWRGSEKLNEIFDSLRAILSVVRWEGLSISIVTQSGTEISIFRRRTYDD